MDYRKYIWKETGIIALGQVICVAAMYGIFALLHRFDLSVVLGGLMGALLGTGNFFFMALSANLAADKAQNDQDIQGGQKLVRSSYLLRMVLLFAILAACGVSGWFNLFALVLPLVFVRPILTVAEFFRKKEEKTV